MRQLDGHALWIGNAKDARDARALLAAGIEAVVDLAAEEQPLLPMRELVHLRFPLVDGGENPAWMLCAAVGGTEQLIRLKVPTLVACSAGISRAPAIAAAAICFRTPNASPDAVLRGLRANGPMDIHPALWAAIKQSVFTLSEAVYEVRARTE